MSATYGWIIDIDHIATPYVEPGSYRNAVGVIGPHDIAGEFEEALNRNDPDTAHMEHFKIYDDDMNLYYEGRFIGDPEEMFGPLNDFGAPNAGATDIYYRDDRGHYKVL